MDFWDEVAGVYDIAELVNKKAYSKMLEGVERLTPKGAVVLDCAAGTGELTIAAAQKASAVVSTDISVPMLNQARKKAAQCGCDNVFFCRRNIFHLEDEDNSYDVTIAGNVLHLLKNPECAVREMYRVTRVGGRLILPTFLLGENDSSKLVDIYKKVGFKPEHNFTVDSYVEMLASSVNGDIRFKYIDGVIPIGFAVIRKEAE